AGRYRIGPGPLALQRSLEWPIDDFESVVDPVCVTRPKAFLVVSVLLAAIVLGATAAPARSGALRETQLRSLNDDIAAAINNFRRVHGLSQLHVSLQLNAAARQHSQEMGADGYFDHASANGTAFWKRIQ